MRAGDSYEVRDYAFADRAAALRKRAGLTQRDLGALLGVSAKAIGAGEAGLSYPEAERLEQLIAACLERAVLPAGREEQEAAELWEATRWRGRFRHLPTAVCMEASARAIVPCTHQAILPCAGPQVW